MDLYELQVYGKYTLLDKTNPSVYAYTREGAGKKILVLLNFSDRAATPKTGFNTSKAKILLANYSTPAKDAQLRPYEAIVYQLRP